MNGQARQDGGVPWQLEIPCPEARMLVSEVDLKVAAPALSPAMLTLLREGLADERPSEQIAAAVELKKQIAILQGPERLRQMVTNLRERYRVATERPTAATLNGTTPPDVATCSEEMLLGEVDSLLERLKIIYTLSSLRDKQIARFRTYALGFLALLLSLLLATRLPAAFDLEFKLGVDQAVNLCVVGLFGAVGSLVSIMRRSQNALDAGPIDIDPVRQISALRQGLSGMMIAALVGPVLALVLFAIFAGGMLSIEGLTPKFAPKCIEDCGFSFFGADFDFMGRTDAAKMAIWAFLAGFAEQLVPDVLDKFTRAAEDTPVGPPHAATVVTVTTPAAGSPPQPAAAPVAKVKSRVRTTATGNPAKPAGIGVTKRRPSSTT